MMKTIERMNLIVILNKYGLDLALIKSFEPEILLQLCNNLKEEQIPASWYMECFNIQKELLSDKQFFFYLTKFNMAKISNQLIDTFLESIRSHGEKALDYPVEQLISAMSMSADTKDVFYDYLKSFSNLNTDKEQKMNIIKNLSLYKDVISKENGELSDAEKSLFMESCLTDRNLVSEEDGKAFDLLIQQAELLKLIRFFYKKNLRLDFSMENRIMKNLVCHQR